MKFIHAADIHLDSPLRGLDRYDGAPASEIRGAPRKALENLVSLALEEEVDFVILAGDLFDGDWPDFNTGLYFVQQMTRLDTHGIRVYVVRGNHDAESKITRKLPWPKNVQFFSNRKAESITLEEFDVVVHGQSFGQQKVVEDLAASYPPAVPGRINIGVLHTSLDGRQGHASYAPTTLDVLKSRGYEYWALGHVHKREIVNRQPLVVFPGNIQGRHIKETGPKGCELVTLEGNNLRTEHRSLDVLRWHTIDIDIAGAVDSDEVLERTGSALRGVKEDAEGRLSAVRVTITGRSTAHNAIATHLAGFREQVRALAINFGQDSIWLEKVNVSTSTPIDMEALKARIDPIGELVRQLALLESGNREVLDSVATELQSIRQKLPAELTEGPERVPLDNSEDLRQFCTNLGPQLLSRSIASEPQS